MKIIGITGPTGAGKSLLSEYFRKNGIPVIDADKVYHSLLVPPSECLDALRKAFGNGIFQEDELDRRALSEIVFHDEEKLALLNHTVLDFVLDECRKTFADLEKEGHAVSAVDAPTLIESGFWRECDRVISVLSDPDIRVERIMARDGLTKEAAATRVRGQRDDSFYIEKSDTVLMNDRDEAAFLRKCDELVKKLKGDRS